MTGSASNLTLKFDKLKNVNHVVKTRQMFITKFTQDYNQHLNATITLKIHSINNPLKEMANILVP